MESFSLTVLVEILKGFGPFGVVVIMWWLDGRNMRKILEQYKADMVEMRQMYKNNVHLVEAYEQLSCELKDIIIMNTTAQTTLTEVIRQMNK